MGKVNAVYVLYDEVKGGHYNMYDEVYKLDDHYVYYEEDGYICVDSITEKNENELIVKMDDESFKTVSFYVEGRLDAKDIDLEDEAVVHFLKYLVKQL